LLFGPRGLDRPKSPYCRVSKAERLPNAAMARMAGASRPTVSAGGTAPSRARSPRWRMSRAPGGRRRSMRLDVVAPEIATGKILDVALEIATGKITADACRPRHRHQDFLRFLTGAAAHPGADLHVVPDNDVRTSTPRSANGWRNQ